MNELLRLGERGRRWMTRDFSWDTVAEQMAAVYTWLRGGGTPPPSVRVG
jgi:hypothetical protein